MTNFIDIQFGTSGYRGVVPDTFNLGHVEPISRSIATWLLGQYDAPRVFIGFDPRSGNTDQTGFPSFCAQFMTEMGIDVVFATHPVPTPLVSWVVKTQGVHGGVIFTASHNPPQYNGIKFNPYPGGPAEQAITSKIEHLCQTQVWPTSTKRGALGYMDYVGAFSSNVADYVQRYVSIKRPIPVVIDYRHGTASPVWRALANQGFVAILDELNAEMRADFGGIDPNPTAAGAVDSLGQRVIKTAATIGIAHDPDADRHVIVDELGELVSPEMVAAVIALHCTRRNIPLGGIVSTVASSSIVRALCDHLKLNYFETAVGFKYFAPYFLSAECPVIGVESSGGFSVSDYLHEKCGFLPGLWIGAIAMDRNLRVSELVAEVRQIVGAPTFIETSFQFDNQQRDALISRLGQVTSWEGMGCSTINRLDGYKWSDENGTWVLVRFSGTEPLGRVYVESKSETLAKKLISQILGHLR